MLFKNVNIERSRIEYLIHGIISDLNQSILECLMRNTNSHSKYAVKSRATLYFNSQPSSWCLATTNLNTQTIGKYVPNI